MSRFGADSTSEMPTVNCRIAPVESGDDRPPGPTPRVPAASRARTLPEVEGYDLLEQIGRGGMGVVYKARQRGLNRLVALKMILHGDKADDEGRLRFLQEARAVAQLHHPNIVPIHHIGVHEDTPYFSLEYVDGGTLQQRVEGRPQIPEFAVRIVEQLADGIHHAHSFGILHRDLKPANVLLENPPRASEVASEAFPIAKITDFGLAKRIDSSQHLTMTGIVAGTPSYMAPERVHPDPRRPIGPASDIYSLGVVLFELLTGRPPFVGNSAMEVLQRVASEEPLSPRAFRPDLPRDLETVCLKCLEKDPARRYQSANLLAEDLRRYRQGRPIVARPVGRVEAWVRWAKRNPRVAATAAGVVCLILASFLLVSWSYLWAEAERLAERRERYRADVALAGSALQMNNSHTARNALNAAPEEYRDWEWRYFDAQFDHSRLTIQDKSNSFGLSPDGRRLAVFSAQGRTELRELPSGRILARTEPRGVSICRLRFSPDGRTLAEGDDDGEIRLLDAETLQTRVAIRAHTRPILTIEFDPRGGRLLTLGLGDLTLRLWDTDTGRPVGSCQTPYLNCRFTPDGESVVIGADNRVTIWNGVDEPRPLFETPGCSNIELVWTRDGRFLAASTRHPDNRIRIWDRQSNRVVRTLVGHRNSVVHIAFSSDGTRLASASFDETARLWDATTGEKITRLQGHTGHLHRIAFAPDGSQLISSGNDGTVRRWDGRTGEPLGVLRGHDDLVGEARFACDGNLILTRSYDGELRFWDTKWLDSHLLRGHSSFAYDVAVSPDGGRVASVGWDRTLCLWDASDGRLLKKFQHDFDIVASVAFDRDGRRLVTVSRDLQNQHGRTATVWDANTGERLGSTPLSGNYFKDSRATYSPTADRIAVAEATGTVRLFDGNLESELARSEGHRKVALDVAFSPDGKLLASGSEDQTIRLLDANTLVEVAMLTGHGDDVLRVVFSPDGKFLASGSADRTVRVWDVASRRQVAELKHGSPVYGLAFTPDGARLAAGCADNTIRLWDTTTWKEVAELRGHTSYLHALAFSPDGSQLFSASGDTTVRVWDTLTVRERAARGKAE